jgi:hypothetical protein
MSNAAAVIGLTFRSVDIQRADFSVFLEVKRGLNEIPEVRGQDTVVPGLAGRYFRNRVADRRTIELRGFVSGYDATPSEAADRRDFRHRVEELRDLFDPTLDPGTLAAALEDGGTATIEARATNVVWNQVAPSLHEVSVEMESVDPEWVVMGS